MIGEWLRRKNIGALHAEPHYKNMRPCVIAEEVLPLEKGSTSLTDYKMWCFNGKCYYTWVCNDRSAGGNSAHVMTYDMGNPPYHNAPLYYSASITKKRSVDQSIMLHVSKGVPLGRLVMGVPFYGHGTDPYKADVKYNEMSTVFSSKYEGKNIRKWDAVAKVPYLVDGDGKFLLGYDDEESVTIKGEYVKNKKLLGAMFWEYRQQTHR